MLSLADCLDFIDVDPETVDVIAEHQSMCATIAAGMADNLIADQKGIKTLHQMHRELISRARKSDDLERKHDLMHVYGKFSRKYPMPGLTA